MTLESAAIRGLDPHAFDVAIRASDAGQASNDIRLREIVEPALAGGALLVASAQIPFTIRDGRLRVGPTTLDSDVARAIVSGGYDIPADQADIRATITSAAIGQASSRPEIQIFAAGSPDALDRTVDVAALSSWLAVRAIDRETRRLDSIERGEPPPLATPASIPPPAAQPPIAAPSAVPGAALPGQPASEGLLPDPRRLPPKPRVGTPVGAPVSVPRPPVAPPVTSTLPSVTAPVVSQQLAPLPPPIEVRPAPGLVPRPPKPRPPLVLTPQNPAQSTY
jgi:large subunit ribosomal protein L24